MYTTFVEAGRWYDLKRASVNCGNCEMQPPSAPACSLAVGDEVAALQGDTGGLATWYEVRQAVCGLAAVGMGLY